MMRSLSNSTEQVTIRSMNSPEDTDKFFDLVKFQVSWNKIFDIWNFFFFKLEDLKTSCLHKLIHLKSYCSYSIVYRAFLCPDVATPWIIVSVSIQMTFSQILCCRIQYFCFVTMAFVIIMNLFSHRTSAVLCSRHRPTSLNIANCWCPSTNLAPCPGTGTSSRSSTWAPCSSKGTNLKRLS